MYPNFQARMDLIAKHLIDPLLSWSVVPGDLQGDSDAQRDKRRRYMNWLGEDVNAVMPSSFNAAQVELACKHAFARIRQTAKTRHWPANSAVVDAMRYGCEGMPSNPGAEPKPRPKLVDQRKPFIALEDLSDDALREQHRQTKERLQEVSADDAWSSSPLQGTWARILRERAAYIERILAGRRGGAAA